MHKNLIEKTLLSFRKNGARMGAIFAKFMNNKRGFAKEVRNGLNRRMNS